MPDRILVEIFEKHLPYEIDMMRLIYREVEARANGPAPKSLQEEAGRNALIEAFCVHVRSLIDFFFGQAQ
jgi:hypothetical protein